jgi:hypothetical protein
VAARGKPAGDEFRDQGRAARAGKEHDRDTRHVLVIGAQPAPDNPGLGPGHRTAEEAGGTIFQKIVPGQDFLENPDGRRSVPAA